MTVPPRASRTPARRQGMTLLEVILALAIFAMALGLLGQLVQTGSRAAAAARDETRAQLVCESVLASVVAGAIPAQQVGGATYEADPEWTYSLDVQPTTTYGLISVQVSVTQNIADAARPTEFTLLRWMRDPVVVEEIEAAIEAEEAAASDTSGDL